DDEGAPIALDGPDEIVEGHGPVMRIAADEIVGRTRGRVVGVADGVDFIRLERHCVSSVTLQVGPVTADFTRMRHGRCSNSAHILSALQSAAMNSSSGNRYFRNSS